jgi:hypothetical protein
VLKSAPFGEQSLEMHSKEEMEYVRPVEGPGHSSETNQINKEVSLLFITNFV